MYSRYIPSANGQKTAIKTASAPTEDLPDTTEQTQIGQPGYSYARYVPGANSSKPAIEKPTVHYFDDEPLDTPSSKRKRQPADDFLESSQGDGEHSKKLKPGGDLSQSELTETPSKKKKKKKKSKSKSIDASSVEDLEPEATQQGQSQSLEEEHSEEHISKKKSKRDGDKKKKKKDRDDEEPTYDQTRDEDQDVTMVDVVDDTVKDSSATLSPEPAKEEKEKKKEKRKKQKEPRPEDDTPTDNEDDQRHKTVLDRKAKSLRLAGEAPKEDTTVADAEPQEVHELGPLPQPAPAPFVAPQIQYETLPSWLASPIRVSQSTKTPFSELGVLSKAARVLEEKGYPDAFAVQTAALPRLIPSGNHRPGDLLVSAATGSGKTLAYALPIVQDLSEGVVTRLRALVVLPTRELVKQAQEVFELCVKAYEGANRKRVRIGVAIGNQTMKSEQDFLIERESRYDPVAYKQIQEEASSVSDADSWLSHGANGADPRLGNWEGEVVDFSSKVDVLICTPGRLVEHIEQSPGFTLDYVRWLVVDEADKLLAQSFQGWLEIVLEHFKKSKWTAREASDVDLDGVRKVILSATLTRDLSLLNQLALRRPQLILLENEGDMQMSDHALPSELEEFAIRVHDVNLKPLYLLDLLKSHHMTGQTPVSEEPAAVDSDATSDTSSEGSSDTSSDSDSSSESGTSSSGSDSESESEPESESESKATKAPSKTSTPKSTLPTALIFTKSNEAALRLSRLLTLLDGSLEQHISTLTSTTPTHIRRKTLRAFTTASSPLRLIIASDLVARGIDLPNLDNVINYDLPPSVAAYVHRVGRTARAGRSGRAWTLVGDEESGWFWGKIAKGASVRRPKKVERIRIDEIDEERVHTYESALRKLGQEALDIRRK
ncbi:unnamed protein product [Clonostachys rosea]|uniref:ATP-dependent RNA helicase n=1 Tax=Bionectria ochroleuca TaxID=29856 RepID=A0ABY6UUY0_BIOOC|nr:unnamed protein product [Clonostachys rosea]